jgi:hypothetical protein
VRQLLGYLVADAVALHTPHPAGHWGELLVLVVASIAWAAVVIGMLTISGSKLMLQLKNRRTA